MLRITLLEGGRFAHSSTHVEKPMRTHPLNFLLLLCLLPPLFTQAQVYSGSNGSDGAFNPTANVTIDMANHPNGIYQYTSVKSDRKLDGTPLVIRAE